jgi:hypothetical protein
MRLRVPAEEAHQELADQATFAQHGRTAQVPQLDAREERVRELEADRDALIASYAEVVPEALDGLTGEDQSRVYRMLKLEVRAQPGGV